jgi:hypothetical protein
MKKIIFASFFLANFLVVGSASAKIGPDMKAFVSLTMGSDFVAETHEVDGQVEKKGDLYIARGIVIHLKNLKTKIGLRDRHTQKHLETDKYPDAVLLIAKGKEGKGKAKIKFHGEEKIVSGTYTLLGGGKFMDAKFPIQLPDFGITGIRYMGMGVKDTVSIEVIVPVKSGT